MAGVIDLLTAAFIQLGVRSATPLLPLTDVLVRSTWRGDLCASASPILFICRILEQLPMTSAVALVRHTASILSRVNSLDTLTTLVDTGFARMISKPSATVSTHQAVLEPVTGAHPPATVASSAVLPSRYQQLGSESAACTALRYAVLRMSLDIDSLVTIFAGLEELKPDVELLTILMAEAVAPSSTHGITLAHIEQHCATTQAHSGDMRGPHTLPPAHAATFLMSQLAGWRAADFEDTRYHLVPRLMWQWLLNGWVTASDMAAWLRKRHATALASGEGVGGKPAAARAALAAALADRDFTRARAALGNYFELGYGTSVGGDNAITGVATPLGLLLGATSPAYISVWGPARELLMSALSAPAVGGVPLGRSLLHYPLLHTAVLELRFGHIAAAQAAVAEFCVVCLNIGDVAALALATTLHAVIQHASRAAAASPAAATSAAAAAALTAYESATRLGMWRASINSIVRYHAATASLVPTRCWVAATSSANAVPASTIVPRDWLCLEPAVASRCGGWGVGSSLPAPAAFIDATPVYAGRSVPAPSHTLPSIAATASYVPVADSFTYSPASVVCTPTEAELASAARRKRALLAARGSGGVQNPAVDSMAAAEAAAVMPAAGSAALWSTPAPLTLCEALSAQARAHSVRGDVFDKLDMPHLAATARSASLLCHLFTSDETCDPHALLAQLNCTPKRAAAAAAAAAAVAVAATTAASRTHAHAADAAVRAVTKLLDALPLPCDAATLLAQCTQPVGGSLTPSPVEARAVACAQHAPATAARQALTMQAYAAPHEAASSLPLVARPFARCAASFAHALTWLSAMSLCLQASGTPASAGVPSVLSEEVQTLVIDPPVASALTVVLQLVGDRNEIAACMFILCAKLVLLAVQFQAASSPHPLSLALLLRASRLSETASRLVAASQRVLDDTAAAAHGSDGDLEDVEQRNALMVCMRAEAVRVDAQARAWCSQQLPAYAPHISTVGADDCDMDKALVQLNRILVEKCMGGDDTSRSGARAPDVSQLPPGRTACVHASPAQLLQAAATDVVRGFRSAAVHALVRESEHALVRQEVCVWSAMLSAWHAA